MSKPDEVWAACNGTVLDDCDLAATLVVVLQVEEDQDVTAAVLACAVHATWWQGSTFRGGAVSVHELFTAAQLWGHGLDADG